MTQTTIQIKEPKAPATPAQIGFLESLIKDRECPSVAERYAFSKGFLTKGAASTLITEAKAAPKKPYKAPVPTVVVDSLSELQATMQAEVAAETITATMTELPAFGYYQLDGTTYYWDCTGKDAFPVLRKLVILQIWGGGQKGSWKKVYGGYNSPKVQGTYLPYNGKGWSKDALTKLVTVPQVLATAVMNGAKPLSEAAAGALGKQFGFCIRCGATLTDPVSVANGIGPVCAKYWA